MTECSDSPFISRIFLLVLFLLQAVSADLSAASQISNYQATFIPFYTERGTLLAAIRRYDQGSEPLFLVLDPERFELKQMPAEKVISSRPAGNQAWQETSFFRALTRLTSAPYPLQNDGLQEAEYPVKGFFLTVDLCPSKKPMDRGFFEATAALPHKPPIPVALMVSGLWIQRHADDLAWLKDQVASGRLAITWVNHSFTHPYDPVASLERNYLLMPKTDFAGEVLSLERLLLEQGLTLSPFFRFPALVSDRRLIDSLRNLCLIPIGSNAWLAKGESPKMGSIILVHANGNEPEGIRLLVSFYEQQRAAFLRRDSVLLPLREAFLHP